MMFAVFLRDMATIANIPKPAHKNVILALKGSFMLSKNLL